MLSLAEIILFSLFLLLWVGIIAGKWGRVERRWKQIETALPVKWDLSLSAGSHLFGSMCTELFPIFQEQQEIDGQIVLIPWLKMLIQREIFPIQRYSEDYWDGNENLTTHYSDTVPDYFTESDEGNVEEKKKDAGSMSKTGNGKSYSLKTLSNREFLLKHFYIIDESTSVTAEEMNGKKLAQKDLSLSEIGKEPRVLIYHTHGSETYKKEDGHAGSVVEVGTALEKELKTYGIQSIHDTSIYDQVNGELDRSAAYNYAGDSVKAALEKHPSIQVVLDVHRDSVEDSIHLTTDINGKKTAQIMFFNGVSRRADFSEREYLYNPNKIDNLACSLQMQLLAARYYPGFTRKIYIKGYRYNLHLAKRAMLVEVGAQNNTVSEAKNAMKPLAELLFRLLSGEKAYKQE